MKAVSSLLFFGIVAAALPGCVWVPATDWNTAQTQHRVLAEQNRVQLAEIENLRIHNRELEDRVISNEKQLAARPDAGKWEEGDKSHY
jgi:hypothetical protein